MGPSNEDDVKGHELGSDHRGQMRLATRRTLSFPQNSVMRGVTARRVGALSLDGTCARPVRYFYTKRVENVYPRLTELRPTGACLLCIPSIRGADHNVISIRLHPSNLLVQV